MLSPRLVTVTVLTAVLATLAGCGGSSSTPSSAPTTSSSATTAAPPAATGSAVAPAATSAAAASTAPASSAASTGGTSPAGPSFINGGAALADTGNLVYVLEAVNPKVGTNKDDLIAKSKALCVHINAHESAGQLTADAAKGFTNGAYVPSDGEAEAIVGTVKAYAGC